MDALIKQFEAANPGIKAVAWSAGLVTQERVSEFGFMTDQPTVLRSDPATLTCSGQFEDLFFVIQDALARRIGADVAGKLDTGRCST